MLSCMVLARMAGRECRELSTDIQPKAVSREASRVQLRGSSSFRERAISWGSSGSTGSCRNFSRDRRLNMRVLNVAMSSARKKLRPAK